MNLIIFVDVPSLFLKLVLSQLHLGFALVFIGAGVKEIQSTQNNIIH
jgi:hypothetical protein